MFRVSDATVDASEIREANQLRLVNIPISYKVLYIGTGCLGGSSSHYLQGSIHPRWLFGISAINSMICLSKYEKKTSLDCD